MTAEAPERQVRISRIAGRYLIFDIEDVVYIRRRHGICAVLTGTMPQNPTQNLFLGLPVELHAEEAKLLVDKGVGYVADELSDHLSQLRATDRATRAAYLSHLKQQRRSAQQAFDEERAMIQARHRGKRRDAAAPKAAPPSSSADPSSVSSSLAESDSLFETPAPPPPPPISEPKHRRETLPSITPTTSAHLLPPPASPAPPADTTTAPSSLGTDHPAALPSSSRYALCRYLNSRGYYTTPGLRFGGDYSVYPGDPFRYHAHYLANSYGWDEEVAMLDIVTSGRLGTAVKKSFLFGAERPFERRRAQVLPPGTVDGAGRAAHGGAGAGAEGDEEREGEVRVFCVEWAGM